MQIRYYKEYSRFLNRFREFKVFGHAGRPIVIFPCQSGRFFDWEDRNMCNAAAPWIDSGKLQIFAVDSIDPESWDNHGPERPRIEMQERWYNYICEEFIPRLLEINREQGEDHTGHILTGGASMGGGHAVNFYLRRPDIFNGTIALSGLYSSGMFFGNYMDDLVYRNSPCDYMRNFPTTHPYMKLFEKADKFIMCCGQGAGRLLNVVWMTFVLGLAATEFLLLGWLERVRGVSLHRAERFCQHHARRLPLAVACMLVMMACIGSHTVKEGQDNYFATSLEAAYELADGQAQRYAAALDEREAILTDEAQPEVSIRPLNEDERPWLLFYTDVAPGPDLWGLTPYFAKQSVTISDFE